MGKNIDQGAILGVQEGCKLGEASKVVEVMRVWKVESTKGSRQVKGTQAENCPKAASTT